jgi:hypothetical protein
LNLEPNVYEFHLCRFLMRGEWERLREVCKQFRDELSFHPYLSFATRPAACDPQLV